MGAISGTSLGDIVRGFGRYRPVVVTVAVVAVVAVVLGPNGGDEGEDLASVSLTGDAPTATVGAVAPTESTASRVGDASAVRPETTDSEGRPTTPLVAMPVSERPQPEPTSSDPGGGSTEDGWAMPTTASSPPSTSPPPAEAPPTPLAVRAAGWATADADTPLAGAGVPEGTLPVGVRLGRADKESYVRLSGTQSVLTLRTDEEGRRSTAGQPAVQACRIVEPDWEPADAMAFDDAPAVDRESCVDGTIVSEGTWQFDLGVFAERTDDRGFALVAAADAPVDFQVVFHQG